MWQQAENILANMNTYMSIRDYRITPKEIGFTTKILLATLRRISQIYNAPINQFSVVVSKQFSLIARYKVEIQLFEEISFFIGIFQFLHCFPFIHSAFYGVKMRRNVHAQKNHFKYLFYAETAYRFLAGLSVKLESRTEHSFGVFFCATNLFFVS